MHRRQRHLNPASAGAPVALDARFIAGQADNTTLQTWSSRPGASITASQSTAGSRPTYRSSSMNGQPALVFDGADDCYDLSSAALSLTKDATGIVAMCVHQCVTVTDAVGYTLFMSSGGSAGSSRFSIRPVDTSTMRVAGSFRRTDGDSNVITAQAGSPANPSIARITADYAGGFGRCAVNAGTERSVAFSSGAGPGPTNDSLVARIGGASTAAQRSNLRVGIMVIMTPAPSTSLLKRIRHHMAYSYKITSQ